MSVLKVIEIERNQTITCYIYLPGIKTDRDTNFSLLAHWKKLVLYQKGHDTSVKHSSACLL